MIRAMVGMVTSVVIAGRLAGLGKLRRLLLLRELIPIVDATRATESNRLPVPLRATTFIRDFPTHDGAGRVHGDKHGFRIGTVIRGPIGDSRASDDGER